MELENENQAIKEIAKREGKRSETSVGNLRETFKVIATIEADALAAQAMQTADPVSELEGLAFAEKGICELIARRAQKLAVPALKRLMREKAKADKAAAKEKARIEKVAAKAAEAARRAEAKKGNTK